MPAHIFVVDEPNFEICVRQGLAGIFELANKKTNELILSHMLLLKIGNPVLFYIKGRQELHGVWEVSSEPFYDTARVWSDRLYPYRVCIRSKEENVFPIPLKLSDIYLLRDAGLIWNFNLRRNQWSSNAIIEITNNEFDIIFKEFVKTNPEGGVSSICEPKHRYQGTALTERLSYKSGKNGTVKPQYECTIMGLLVKSLTDKKLPFFSKHCDYISYVQTDWGKEIDLLLIYEHPSQKGLITSYDLFEIKKDRFGSDGLTQLLSYESWFVKSRAGGDSKMVRSIAIAASFHDDVISYLKKRACYEGKNVLLFKYSVNHSRMLEIHQVL